jgi:hypothetical protein
MSDWIENPGKEPRNKDTQWWLRFACGEESTAIYNAKQIRWTKTGSDWDVSHARRA